MLVRKLIAQLLAQAVEGAQAQGILPKGSLPEVVIERPQNSEHGDFATALPLRLSRALSKDPMDIARDLVAQVPQEEAIDRVWAAPPGFINIALKRSWLRDQVQGVLAAAERYGNLDLGAGQRVQVEFVSANPTGPLHVGHGRGAVLGSALANILEAAGYSITREYYVNDGGSQMDSFSRSLYARYKQALGQEAELPSGGYMGSYMVDLGQEIASEEGDRFLQLSEEEGRDTLGRLGLQKMLGRIEGDLAALRVEFDSWFNESTLYQEDRYKEAMGKLEEGGHLAKKEGALWFVSTALGEDKDNVLVRSSGLPTYFASDAAYHYDKLGRRGFDRVIDIWGADHKGHVSRVKAVISAMGLDASKLDILISQLVTLKRGQETVRASKRTGEMVTLREVIDEVGSDACRYFFLSRGAESQMEFDLELAKQQSQENPVYYIQYAHARIAGISRNARERGLDLSQGDVSLLTDKAELDLIRQLILLPELIESMAQSLEPHHLAHYALELATAFHWFYDQCRVITDDQDQTRARLKLVEASRIVLARVLQLMGMNAPERM